MQHEQPERYTSQARKWRGRLQPLHRSQDTPIAPAQDVAENRPTVLAGRSASLTHAAAPSQRLAALHQTSSASLGGADDVPTLAQGASLGKAWQRFSGNGLMPLAAVARQERSARLITLMLVAVAATLVVISAFLLFFPQVRHPGFGLARGTSYHIETPTLAQPGVATATPLSHPPATSAGGKTGTPRPTPTTMTAPTPTLTSSTLTPTSARPTPTPTHALPTPTPTRIPPTPTRVPPTPTPAPPPTATQCYYNPSPYHCNNVDPTTGNPNCLSPAFDEEETDINGVGFFRNWHNTQCLSNWTQAHAFGGNSFIYQVEIESAPHDSAYCNGNSGTCDGQAYRLIDTVTRQTTWYTNLVFTPPGTSARSCARYMINGNPSGWYCGGWH